MVDVSIDFPVTVSTELEIGNVPGIDATEEGGLFGATFSAEVDATRSFIDPSPKFGVKFAATIEDRNKRTFDTAMFGATFEAEFTYTEPAPSPQPGTPAGQDIFMFEYYGCPAIQLPLLPCGLGQRPAAQIVHEFKGHKVQSLTHIEQRQNYHRLPFRTYTFDYVISPMEQFAIKHIMENTDRFVVAVPLFPEMYRLSCTIKAGETDLYMITEPEYHLYHSEYVFLIDGQTKHGCFHKITAINNDPTTNVEPHAGSLSISPGAAVDYTPDRFALFPVLIGWVDAFEPDLVNRKAVSGSLTIREGRPAIGPRGYVKPGPVPFSPPPITDPFDPLFPGYNEAAIMTDWIYGLNDA